MKRNNVSKILFTVLVVVFIFMILFLRAQKLYDEKLYEEVYELFPTSSHGGFSLKLADVNLSLEKPTAAKHISIMPGEQYSGALLLKNHENRENKMVLSLFGAFLGDEEKSVVLDFEFEDPAPVLKPHEWTVVKYTVKAPEDLEKGEYKGVVSVRKDEIMDAGGGTGITYGVGVEFYVEVSENPTAYVFQDIVDPDVNLERVALYYVYEDFKKILGLLFAVLAVFFLYKGLKVQKRNKKRKEEKEMASEAKGAKVGKKPVVLAKKGKGSDEKAKGK